MQPDRERKFDFWLPDRAKPDCAERPKHLVSRCRTQRSASSHSPVLEVERKPSCDDEEYRAIRALSRGDMIVNDASLFVNVRAAAPSVRNQLVRGRD
jgi:hypothetical protein